MKKLLIVEDDPLMRQFYNVLFQRNGFYCHISDNGDEIVSYLNSNIVDLIIMDINLNNTYLNGERINGFSLLTEIRRIQKFKKIPVVLVTAHSIPLKNDFGEIIDSWVYVVTKPIVNYSEFVNTIQKLIPN